MSYTIGGQEYQHALIDLQSSAGGKPFQHDRFKSLSYEDGAEKSPVYDSQGRIIAYVVKPQKTDGAVTMLMSEWWTWEDWLRQEADKLTAANPLRQYGIGQVVFALTVQYGATLDTLRTDIIEGCMVQAAPKKSDDNQEALVVEVKLFLTGVKDAKTNRRFMAYKQ